VGGQILSDSHRRSEEALRESEARFHALVQNAQDIVMVTDARGTIRYMSPSVERVLGYTPEEMVGTTPGTSAGTFTKTARGSGPAAS
jgi:PAS domain-containing protein